jgi:hypothetical protein
LFFSLILLRCRPDFGLFENLKHVMIESETCARRGAERRRQNLIRSFTKNVVEMLASWPPDH